MHEVSRRWIYLPIFLFGGLHHTQTYDHHRPNSTENTNVFLEYDPSSMIFLKIYRYMVKYHDTEIEQNKVNINTMFTSTLLYKAITHTQRPTHIDTHNKHTNTCGLHPPTKHI